MCSELAKKALGDLVKHVHRYDEILLITPEVAVSGVYEKLYSLPKPDSSGHLLIDTICGKVEFFDGVAVTLRACNKDPLSHEQGQTRERGLPREASGPVTRGPGRANKEGGCGILECAFRNKKKTITHTETEELVGNGSYILKCPETKGVFLSLRTQITRSEDLVKLKVDQFSIHSSSDCVFFLNKWNMGVCAYGRTDVDDVGPRESRRVVPRTGDVMQDARLGVGTHGPLNPLGGDISVGRSTRIGRGGVAELWVTSAARSPENSALLNWSTWLWLEKREAGHVFGRYNTPTLYFLGEEISDGGFTLDLGEHSPWASFNIPSNPKSEEMRFGYTGFEVKLKAHLRGPSRPYNTYKLAEVEKAFRITNIFESYPDPTSLI